MDEKSFSLPCSEWHPEEERPYLFLDNRLMWRD
jgi:hypothetical protein